MKKVLFVATVVQKHINVFHLPYLKWFKENGYETHVCARNDFEIKSECTIPYCDEFHEIKFERSPIDIRNFKAYAELKKIINNNYYDIIHCHTPVGGALARLAGRKARKNNTKIIYTAHGFHFYNSAPIINWVLYYPIELFLSKYTDTLITINKEDYRRAKKSFKYTNIEYIPGVGIDIQNIKNTKINKEKYRNKLDIPNESFLIISVGELNDNKNHELVIKAIAKLKEPNLTYCLCGEGPLGEKLRVLAEELNVSEQIKFLGFRTDVNEILQASDLFVFPSFREGLSVALMEAMASKLPIVCSKIRGNVDLVIEGKGGYLLSPTDVDGFAKCIKRIIEDTELKSRLGQFNQDKIKEFDKSNVMEKMEQIYRLYLEEES